MQLSIDLPDETVARLRAQAERAEQPVEALAGSLLQAIARTDPLPPSPSSEEEAAGLIDQAHELRAITSRLTDAYDGMRDLLSAFFQSASIASLDSGHHKATLQKRRKIPKENLDDAIAWLKANGQGELIKVRESVMMKELEGFLEISPVPPPAYFDSFSTYVQLGR